MKSIHVLGVTFLVIGTCIGLTWSLISGGADSGRVAEPRRTEGTREARATDGARETLIEPAREPVEVVPDPSSSAIEVVGEGAEESVHSEAEAPGDKKPEVGSPEFLRQRLAQYRESFPLSPDLSPEDRLANALALNKVAIVTILDCRGQYESIPQQGVSVTSADRGEWISTHGRMYRLMPGQFPEYSTLGALVKSTSETWQDTQVSALIGEVEARFLEAEHSIPP